MEWQWVEVPNELTAAVLFFVAVVMAARYGFMCGVRWQKNRQDTQAKYQHNYVVYTKMKDT